MPRKKKDKSKRQHGHGATATLPTTGDQDDSGDEVGATAVAAGGIDTESVLSSLSDNASIATNDVDELGGEDLTDDNESALIDIVDSLQENKKSGQTRVKPLESLRRHLSHCVYGEDFMSKRGRWIVDVLKLCWTKCRLVEEKCLVVKCFCLLYVHTCVLGGDTGPEIFSTFISDILRTLLDQAAKLALRSVCAMAYGMAYFLNPDKVSLDRLEAGRNLEQVYKGSYLKGDRVPPVHKEPLTYKLHADALNAAALLMTCDTADRITTNRQLSQLAEILEMSDVNLRIAAGTAMCVLCESARLADPTYHPYRIPILKQSLPNTLTELSTDSGKHNSKKDRRSQKSFFRDVETFFVENRFTAVKKYGLGSMELMVESWSIRHRYECFCYFLGTGIRVHFQKNDLLQDIFEESLCVTYDKSRGAGASGNPNSKPDKQLWAREKFLKHQYDNQERQKQRNKKETSVMGYYVDDDPD